MNEDLLASVLADIPAPVGSTRPCRAHKYHSPRPSLTHLHHILPLSWGGADENNLVAICPTGHYSVHALLSLLRMHNGPENLPSGTLVQYGPGERAIALDGWQRFLDSQADN